MDAHGLENLPRLLQEFALAHMIVHDGSEKSTPAQIKLPDYPQELVDQVLSNDTSHPLLTMSHVDSKGGAFCSVMGFSYNQRKINIATRPSALKLQALRERPRFSVIYHNNMPRPELLACVTLVGNAELSVDPEVVETANTALSKKVFRPGDPDFERLEPMIESMRDVERVVIIMKEVTGVYIVSPMLPNLPAGRPTPVISWSAPRAKPAVAA